jgi:uroporphyrinogen-III synthase
VQVLVTRPPPEAARTAARLIELGHQVMLAPLLATAPLDWVLPATMPGAVAFTSAAAVRLAGPQLASLRHLPVFAVGAATAAAARVAGLKDLPPSAAAGTAAALLEQVKASGIGRVLYLAGRDRTVHELPPGIELREVYAVLLADTLPQRTLDAFAARAIDLTLLYSARTAAHFAALIDAARLDRGKLHIAALSRQVLAAAGPGWASRITAVEPTETALMIAAGLLA